MLEALILVCSFSMPADIRNCNDDNAIYVMRLDVGGINPSSCARDVEAFVAGSSLVDALTARERLKIICRAKSS